MDRSHLESRLLRYVNRAGYKPIKPRVMAERLELTDDERREIKRAIKHLAREGKLTYGSNHLVHPAERSKSQQVTGVYRRTKRGFGFVRPSGSRRDRADDIYISEKKSRDAASGDVVLVRVGQSRGPQSKLRGEIVEVVRRQTHQFVGTYDRVNGMGVVRIDGGIFGQPIPSGDASAKSVQPDDKVVVEMVLFPSHARDGECVITEVLGERGAPGIDTLSIMREYNLPDDFPADVVQAAREQADRFTESIDGNRVDLTDLIVITIDPKDARDFDDAISLERMDNRHWRLGVHIADVAHFVRPRTPLDREARERATSVYLPDRVIPMLPEVISNNLASLQPNRVRYTKSVFIEFTPEGARLATDFHSGAIRSRRRFSYEEVDDFLTHPTQWKRKLKPHVFELLGRMHELALILRARRFHRGSLELSLPEIKIDLDKHGRVCGAHLVKHTESHQMIEEFMLAANEAVAESLRDRELLFLRRIHEAPDPRKLKGLTEFVRELGIKIDSLESRFELQRVLDLVRGLPQQHAVNYATLRSMQKAIYSSQEEGHFALASDCYCHFTSPIRRYPDLTVHRLIDSILRGKRPQQDLGRLLVEGEHCSDREQRAEEAERELTKLKLLNYLSERIGDELEAVITGVEDFGLFAQGIYLPAEGLIHVQSLQDDHYRFDRNSHSLVGNRAGNSFRLGDTVTVQIAHVDVDARKLDLRLVQGHVSRTRKSRSTRKSKNSEPQTKTQTRKSQKKSSKPKTKPKQGRGTRKTKARRKKKR